MTPEAVDTRAGSESVWRALANPVRRQLLDSLSIGPRTTGELAEMVPALSRFAVMQHLGVLEESGLVVVRRRGRHRFNHLNPVPLRRWYERWVVPMADAAAAEMLALQRSIERSEGGTTVSVTAPAPATTDEFRTVRVETELRFRATPERVFEAITERSLEWFPSTYGEDRVKAIVIEPRVGGAHYEDWGDAKGHLYGHVTVWDAPFQLSTRGRLMPGTILDSEYLLEAEGEETVLKVSKVAVGPITDHDAGLIQKYGDIALFEKALRAVVERP